MKAAVLIILYGGLFYGFWLIYTLIHYRYGEKIKAYRQRQRDLRECDKILLEARLETLEKIKKRSEVIEVDVEDLGQSSFSWKVYNSNRLGETLVSTELIVND